MLKRIKISNKRIERFFQKKHDQELITKLKTIKPTIKIQCPESYIFYKTQFNSYKTEPKKLDLKNNIVNIKKRMRLKSKLVIEARNKNEKFPLNILSMSNCNNKNNVIKHFISGRSLFETSKLFDDNTNFSKRIKEKSSYYSLSQWKKDFKKSRIYKKISCEYPSINFVGKPKRKIKRKNHEMIPTKFKNIFDDVRFIPLNSFSAENKLSGSNSKEKDNNKALKKIRKIKFLNLLEQNNKVIFNQKLNEKKRMLKIEST